MSFVLRMAWRETRASWLRLLFFFLCVALGVASIVVLRSVMQNVRVMLTGEARALVGADLVLRSSRPWSEEARRQIDGLLDVPGVLDRTELIETQTMAAGRADGPVRLVELRGLGPGFPYYGAIELDNGQLYTHDLVAGHGVLVPSAFLVELGLEVGDTLRLAGQDFTIRGLVVEDRLQRGGGFAFGPRVYIDVADLRTTTLLGFGSRAEYQILARVTPEALTDVTDRLRDGLSRDAASVRTWRNLEDRLGRNLNIAENYLSLVGFAIVVLGGIGVWSVTRVIVQQKIRSVAVLKCLGASSRQVLATYVTQAVWLAAGGSLLGIVLAVVALMAVPASLLALLGVDALAVTWSAALQGLLVGLLVSLLFALIPLLDVRRVKPLLLLRAHSSGQARERNWETWVAAIGAGCALALVATWQAGSLTAGAFVTAGLIVVSGVLMMASRGLVRLTAPLARSSWFALRHAVVGLGRPGNQTRVVLTAVGIGCFFILGIRAVQASLLAELDAQTGSQTPDLVLIDVQQDQVAGVRALADGVVEGEPRLMPLMRGRVDSVEGSTVSLPDREAVRRQRGLTREYGITYRDGLESNERVVEGEFWATPLADARLDDAADTEVSIERQVSDEAGVQVGDLMRFDLSGQILSARVTSIREVAWDDTQNGGFVFVLRPGPAVDRMPQSFVGFLEVSDDPVRVGRFQRDLVAGFPNVSIIDVRDVLASIREIVDHVTLGITAVGALTLGGGILILVGAVAMTKFQRLYESAIYRTLGAGSRTIASMVLIEFGTLGLLAGLLGAGGALVLSWALSRFLFEIPWEPQPLLFVTGVVSAAVAVAVVGLAATADVVFRKPLATLRSDQAA